MSISSLSIQTKDSLLLLLSAKSISLKCGKDTGPLTESELSPSADGCLRFQSSDVTIRLWNSPVAILDKSLNFWSLLSEFVSLSSQSVDWLGYGWFIYQSNNNKNQHATIFSAWYNFPTKGYIRQIKCNQFSLLCT